MAQFRPQAQFNSEGRILITLTLPSPHRGISANLEVFPLIPPFFKGGIKLALMPLRGEGG